MSIREHDNPAAHSAASSDLIRDLFLVEPMTEEDIREVGRLERRCFTNPWPASAYRRELRKPERNVYIVLRQVENTASNGSNANGNQSRLLSRFSRSSVLPALGLQAKVGLPIVGFAGFWLTFGESHITTIAVKPELQRRHLGELLLLLLIDIAERRDAGFLSLEVRESNVGAIRLYTKYGFRTIGLRHGYYTDDGEDAIVMRSPELFDHDYQDLVTVRREELADHLNSDGIRIQFDGLSHQNDQIATDIA